MTIDSADPREAKVTITLRAWEWQQVAAAISQAMANAREAGFDATEYGLGKILSKIDNAQEGE